MLRLPQFAQNVKQDRKRLLYKNMIYAVLDTNVLVSALMSKSAESTINQLIMAVVDNRLTMLYAQEIIDEYEEVLSREKFHFIPEVQPQLSTLSKTEALTQSGFNKS